MVGEWWCLGAAGLVVAVVVGYAYVCVRCSPAGGRRGR